MSYIIIDQEDLNMVNPAELGESSEVPGVILDKIKNGRTPRVFQEIQYDISIKVKEVKKDETVKNKTLDDKGTGGKGNSEVRPGDTGAPESKH